ncbi:MAG: transglycosylase family protein [Thermoleophilia bacterium]|nr:transglycosylase family protein [Thermoleophilia bacterium]
MDKANHSKTARNSVLVLALIAVVIVAGNLLVDRSEDPAGAETALAQAGVVSSESSTLTAFNLAAKAKQLRVEQESRETESEGNHLEDVTARELEAARHGQEAVAPQQSQKPQVDFSNLPGSVSRATLESIAACESGGDPKVISSNGLYHGKYQFSPETWESVGGKGLPSDAPEAEQDYRAALLYERSGPGQWPVCGS